MEDFNEITCPNEKLDGTTPNVNKFQLLHDFLTNINAQTLQVSGDLFTWKKRVHTHLIYERLDRIIARNNCANIYPNAIAW